MTLADAQTIMKQNYRILYHRLPADLLFISKSLRIMNDRISRVWIDTVAIDCTPIVVFRRISDRWLFQLQTMKWLTLIEVVAGQQLLLLFLPGPPLVTEDGDEQKGREEGAQMGNDYGAHQFGHGEKSLTAMVDFSSGGSMKWRRRWRAWWDRLDCGDT